MINSYFEKVSSEVSALYNRNSFNFDLHINLNSKPTELLIYIIGILIVAFIVDKLLLNSFLGKNYRIFVAPGVILHEFSHALLCLLTGAKIKKVALFEKDGGSVEHEPSKIPVVGSVLISLAPFAAGILSIYFLSHWLGIKEGQINFLNIDYNEALSSIKKLSANIDFSLAKNWVILYLALSVVVTMTPSKQDIINMAVPALLFVISILALIYFKVNVNISYLPIDRIFLLLSPILILLILALVFSIIIYALSKLLKH